MLQYYDELIDVLKKYGLTNQDIIIVGSGAITAIGGRENNDIEFCICKNSYKRMPLLTRIRLLFFDHVELSKNVDLFRHRYLVIGILDEQLFEKRLFRMYKECRIVNPEMEYLYKLNIRRDKDLSDLKEIDKNLKLKQAFDWNFINKQKKQRVNSLFNLYRRLRYYMWRIKDKLN